MEKHSYFNVTARRKLLGEQF
jgi:hypothetical protein